MPVPGAQATTFSDDVSLFSELHCEMCKEEVNDVVKYSIRKSLFRIAQLPTYHFVAPMCPYDDVPSTDKLGVELSKSRCILAREEWCES